MHTRVSKQRPSRGSCDAQKADQAGLLLVVLSPLLCLTSARTNQSERGWLAAGGHPSNKAPLESIILFSHERLVAGWLAGWVGRIGWLAAWTWLCFCIVNNRTVSSDLISRLAVGVEQLLALGHPPSAISMFDEAWLLAASLSPFIEEVTGNVPLGDWFTFHVHGGSGGKSQPDNAFRGSRPRAGWGPHRDRPGGVDEVDSKLAPGFRKDGSPMYTTVWVALTDATPDNSCLYFLPARDDPGYKKQGDNIEGVFNDLSRWQAICAQPVSAGESVIKVEGDELAVYSTCVGICFKWRGLASCCRQHEPHVLSLSLVRSWCLVAGTHRWIPCIFAPHSALGISCQGRTTASHCPFVCVCGPSV